MNIRRIIALVAVVLAYLVIFDRGAFCAPDNFVLLVWLEIPAWKFVEQCMQHRYELSTSVDCLTERSDLLLDASESDVFDDVDGCPDWHGAAAAVESFFTT